MREDPYEALADRYRQALRPTPPAIDQQALWFEAGRASVRPARSGWLLKAYSGAATAVAASLALVVLASQQPPDAGVARSQLEAAAETQPELALLVAPSPRDALAGSPPLPKSDATPRLWAALFPPQEVDPNSYLANRDRALRGDLNPLSRDPVSRLFPQAESRVGGDPAEPSPPATRQRLLDEYLPHRNLATPPRPATDPRTELTTSNAKELA